MTEGGYRLRCAKFPAHFSVQIVFALASIDPDLLSRVSNNKNLKPTEWGFGVAELLPTNKFAILETRPSPLSVTIKGNYSRILKRYSIARTIPVGEGN
jgi:hypothetical protein